MKIQESERLSSSRKRDAFSVFLFLPMTLGAIDSESGKLDSIDRTTRSRRVSYARPGLKITDYRACQTRDSRRGVPMSNYVLRQESLHISVVNVTRKPPSFSILRGATAPSGAVHTTSSSVRYRSVSSVSHSWGWVSDLHEASSKKS